MTRTLQRRILSAFVMSIAAIALTACSVAPRIDGGIVGTGNRVDCEAAAKKGGAVPQECERQNRQ